MVIEAVRPTFMPMSMKVTKMAKLDERKKALDRKLKETSDPNEAQAACEELEDVTAKLAETEERWLALEAELEKLNVPTP